mmetsp:Transcript_16853/g.40114  ORF Transcript_16853/g.40114 Transcript_16853/m.40114 type:complete len:254 (+) Transcript_16853:89-850(+)
MKEMSRFQNYCEDSAVCHFTTEDEDGKAVVPLRHVPGFWLQANGVPTAKVRELEERAGEHAQNDEPNKDPGSILSENNAQQAKELAVPKQNREQLRFKVPLKQGASHAFSAGNHAGSEKQTRMPHHRSGCQQTPSQAHKAPINPQRKDSKRPAGAARESPSKGARKSAPTANGAGSLGQGKSSTQPHGKHKKPRRASTAAEPALRQESGGGLVPSPSSQDLDPSDDVEFLLAPPKATECSGEIDWSCGKLCLT